MKQDTIEKWRKEVTLINTYGVTEVCVYQFYHIYSANEGIYTVIFLIFIIIYYFRMKIQKCVYQFYHIYSENEGIYTVIIIIIIIIIIIYYLLFIILE